MAEILVVSIFNVESEALAGFVIEHFHVFITIPCQNIPEISDKIYTLLLTIYIFLIYNIINFLRLVSMTVKCNELCTL